MFFNDYMIESEDLEMEDIDKVITPDTTAEEDVVAAQVEEIIQQEAFDAAQYFEGGAEAIEQFMESAEMKAQLEAFGPFGMNKKNTFVRMSRGDDLRRRTHLACLLLAKNHKDPLFTKLAANRVKERSLRKQIFSKYEQKATKIARLSQRKALANKKKFNFPFFKKKEDDNIEKED